MVRRLADAAAERHLLPGGIATNPAPQLLVGGTADPYRDPAAAVFLGRTARADVLEIPGADHAVTVPGDAVATATALDRVGDAVAALARRARTPS